MAVQKYTVTKKRTLFISVVKDIISYVVWLGTPKVVVVVVTRHGGAATFAEAVFKLRPQDTTTDQGTFQVDEDR